MVVTVSGQEIKLTPKKKRVMLIEVIEMMDKTGSRGPYSKVEMVGHQLSWYDWNRVAALYDTLEEKLITQGKRYNSFFLDRTIGRLDYFDITKY